MKTYINQHVIRANAKNGTSDPAITVKTYRNNYYAHRVEMAARRLLFTLRISRFLRRARMGGN